MPNEYISRKAILAKQYESEGHCGLSTKVVDVRDIEDEPASDVAPVVHARWWPDNMDAGCTNCGSGMPRNPDGSQEESEYCPNCGARMYGGEHHAD